MGNRGVKRPEVEEPPTDKRACNSLGRDAPGSENPSQSQAVVDSVGSVESESHGGDMETGHTGTSYPDGVNVNDSGYSNFEGSGDEHGVPERNSMEAHQLSGSSTQVANLSRVISNLGQNGVDDSTILAALTDLCEQLSFANGNILTSVMLESLSPALVRLAKHETNPNIMLLAIRGMSYTCDVFPRAARIFVKYEAIPALCQRLTAIEYVDVAEQCLQALDKISREQPLACLQSGVIMAALTFIDFFSTGIQRVVLSIVMNICEKLPSTIPPSLIEALPILCSLLQYEDQQVLERVATCLIKITSRFSQSSELLDVICNYGVVSHIIHITDMNNRSTRPALSQTLYTGLIGLVSKLACASLKTCKTLYELNISTILRDILFSCYSSSGLPLFSSSGGHYGQMQEVLKLLNELLPCVNGDQNSARVSEKRSFIVGHPDNLQKLGIDILPPLIQVVNMGADMRTCYGCLSFINKVVHFAEPEVLLELIKNLNISCFLAGVFTRKDPHILTLALGISEAILQKQSHNFVNSFFKDGVFFAIESLLKIELSSQFMFPVVNGTHFSNEPSQRATPQEVGRCLCYALCTDRSSGSSLCKLQQELVNNLAKRIKLNFFPKASSNNGLTKIHHELKASSDKLTKLLTSFESSDDGLQLDEEMRHVLSLILKKLNGPEPISTFEFIESGTVKALRKFLLPRIYLTREPNDEDLSRHLQLVNKRLQIFARSSMCQLDNQSGDLPIVMLVRKLQNALSSVENFPVIMGQPLKVSNSIVQVPDRRATMYPTFKVNFLKGEGDQNLTDYSSNYVTVDPFSSLKSIEEHLWPRVGTRKKASVKSSTKTDVTMQYTPAGAEMVDHMETDIRKTAVLPSEQDMDAHFIDQTIGEHESYIQVAERAQCFRSSRQDAGSPNLSLYLGDQKLDMGLTLYQAILQQQLKSDHDTVNSTNFWSRVYNITFRSESSCGGSSLNQCCQLDDKFHAQNFDPSLLILEITDSEMPTVLDQMSPCSDILYLFKILEHINSNSLSLLSQERVHSFAEKKIEEMNSLVIHGTSVTQKEFVNSRLTEKLEQQMQDHAAMTVGGLPSWWNQLVVSCPFLFPFNTKCKYFRLSTIGSPKDMSHIDSGISSSSSVERRLNSSGFPRQKFLAFRNNVLGSASKMMKQHAQHKAILEVEFANEVGTGLGPTLEFYTLVSHEFQRSGMGMWREDSLMQHNEFGEFLVSRFGLFPRPWYFTEDGSEGTLLCEVIRKFSLLGQIVAKALHDGRVLDLHLSKAFYKIILGQNLNPYDIQLFDPELATALQKFRAISQKNLVMTKMSTESSSPEMVPDLHAREIEDLCLDFTLPGFPDYLLHTEKNHEMVTMDNLKEYISLVEDATLYSGIYKQVEAFIAGFNQVFPIERTRIFTVEELEQLLCGEQHFLTHPDELLNHIKFDHGYTASSPPILKLLEVLQDFDHNQQRAFVQFVTGTPRLPPGGLASLNPRLTIVRKHSDNFVDMELPSAMTCANYLKLPPYSSKEIMKEKLLYAISEGQGSFHLS